MNCQWSHNRLARTSLAIFAGLGVVLNAAPVLACSVCYGDPNSAMNQGAQAGVLVLLGVIGVVLALFVSMLIFWTRRAAQIKAVDEARHGVVGTSRTQFSHSHSHA